jgi:hypothetical protein
MEHDNTTDEEIELQLPNSGLYVTDDFFIKKDTKDRVTGKYRLKDIRELKLRRELDGSSVVRAYILRQAQYIASQMDNRYGILLEKRRGDSFYCYFDRLSTSSTGLCYKLTRMRREMF